MQNTLTAKARDCWFLTGPTASGKTAIGLELAHRLNAEIVSLDSMAIYRGMDIGTAKPTAEEQAVVPHHLLDIVDPTELFSVSDYLIAAERVMDELRERGKQVLFVGGTPLYLKALLRGMFDGPPGDELFRREMLEEAREVGMEQLHRRLQVVDPLSAAKLHPHDVRRVLRALEVFRMTGQPISHQQLQFDQSRPAEDYKVLMLDWPRPLLHERIAARVDRMFELGLVDEVRGLLERHGSLGRTAQQAVGYRETLDYLAGTTSWDLMVANTKTRTRRFAKRQWTWFRQLSECRWVTMADGRSPAEWAETLIDLTR
jgi:tRNA dimethylallyltransferase